MELEFQNFFIFKKNPSKIIFFFFFKLDILNDKKSE